MKFLNKIFTLTFLFTLLILTSCQKEGLHEESDFNAKNHEINTRVPTGFYSSLPMMCTISRDCVTADPFGGCLILFPPSSPIDLDFAANEALGSAFVNQNGNLSFYLYSDLTIPEESKNTSQDFQISNMIVPSNVAEELFGPSSPGEITLNDGNYIAEVADNFLSLSVPSNVGDVDIVIWYNESSNSEVSTGFHHNKFISELHNENGDFYISLSSIEDINTAVLEDCIELCESYELGVCDISQPIINGQSSQDMINNIDGLNVYEKDYLISLVSNVEGIDPFNKEGMGEVLSVINMYESSVSSDSNIENKQAVLSFLSVAKFSTLYWNTQTSMFSGGSLAQRMNRFWWIVTCDAIGAVNGFFLFGPWGSVITGVLYSVIGNLTYDHFFN